MINKNITWFALLFVTLLFTGCIKNESNTYIDFKPYLNVAKDYANTQQLTVRLINTIIKASNDSLLHATGFNQDIDKAKCTFVFDTLSDSSFYTLEYNSWGSVDPYARRRGGIIQVALDGRVSDSGVSGSIDLIHFHYEFDSLKSKAFRIQNEGIAESGYPIFRFSADSMIWQPDSNKMVQWHFNQTYEPLLVGDDSGFVVSGSFDGIATNHIPFTTTVVNNAPLIDKMNCAWLQSGTVALTISGTVNCSMVFPPEEQCLNYYQFWIDDNRFDGSIEDLPY